METMEKIKLGVKHAFGQVGPNKEVTLLESPQATSPLSWHAKACQLHTDNTIFIGTFRWEFSLKDLKKFQAGGDFPYDGGKSSWLPKGEVSDLEAFYKAFLAPQIWGI